MRQPLYLLFLLLMVTACVTAPDQAAYKPSNSSLPMGQGSFSEYVSQTRSWLAKNRLFLTDDTTAELDANTPFELPPQLPKRPSRGILLVHGLADSPYSFVDIAPVLAQMGFRVRTLLLEGHGSRPADLMHADADHWRQLLKEQVSLFKSQVDSLYLGGFSTGANLVTSYAMSDEDIAGLILFSPGFKARSDIDGLASIVPVFTDWLYAPNLKTETNFVRYMVTPSNGFAQFYDTSAEVLFRLKQDTYDKPVFMALSQADSVIDVDRISRLFSKRFTNPDSRLVWFGDRISVDDPRIRVLSAHLPDYHISNFSHMGVLFRPDNRYYGMHGSERICDNGQSDNALYRQCLSGGDIWYSAWGYVEPGKHHARLTFNPWFEQMFAVIRQEFGG